MYFIWPNKVSTYSLICVEYFDFYNKYSNHNFDKGIDGYSVYYILYIVSVYIMAAYRAKYMCTRIRIERIDVIIPSCVNVAVHSIYNMCACICVHVCTYIHSTYSEITPVVLNTNP